MSRIEYREYQPEDAESFVRLHDSCFPALSPSFWPECSQGPVTAAVAMVDGEVVGTVPFQFRDLRVRPDAVGLSGSNGALGPAPIDTLLGVDRWNRMSLQIRADGQLSAVVDDSVVAVHPVPLVNDSTVRWRISVVGHAVDNRLLLRDVTLWREERIPSGQPVDDPRR